ncbi:MAG: hypothetical protein HY321_10625 [Armatimonadetes bacterium]|nr:hypothetical protein [Armatimonadota bacterium]
MAASEETKQRFAEEEQAYWRQRDELLARYLGKWVAIVGGQVVAAGDQMNRVAAEAFRKTGSGLMYVNRVGGEDVVFRVRRAATGRFDRAYSPSMPMMPATVSDVRETVGTEATFVVDTGADVTLLRGEVADDANAWNDLAGRFRVAGIGGTGEVRQFYNALVHIAGRGVLVTSDCRDDIDEDIPGRAVINEFRLTVSAKEDRVEFAWVDET